MNKIKFRWVGLNKHFNEIQIQEGITTQDVREGNTLSFFSEKNRAENGNCSFISEDLFTSASDVNGNDVYDNDICKSDDLIFAVKWSESACAFLACSGDENVPFSWFADVGAEKCEKIGNIHESPELLQASV